MGWQKQPTTEQTVQGQIEKVLSKICNEPIRVIGSGRTDRGAHALCQWAHADVPANAPFDSLTYKMNRLLPQTIRVQSCEFTPEDFHAQRSALAKKYLYRIDNQAIRNPFTAQLSHHVPQPLDTELLNALSAPLIGEMDFVSFQSKGTEVETTVRRIYKASWARRGSIVTLEVIGNGFLKQMVRNIVGTLLRAHQQGQEANEIVKILQSCDRRSAAAPAPAHGLYLKWVKYPPILDNKCRKL